MAALISLLFPPFIPLKGPPLRNGTAVYICVELCGYICRWVRFCRLVSILCRTRSRKVVLPYIYICIYIYMPYMYIYVYIYVCIHEAMFGYIRRCVRVLKSRLFGNCVKECACVV